MCTAPFYCHKGKLKENPLISYSFYCIYSVRRPYKRSFYANPPVCSAIAFFFFLPLIHLFLQLPVEFVYPLLQPLPPLLWGQVAVVFQRRRLVVKAGNAQGFFWWVTFRLDPVPRWARLAAVTHQHLLSCTFWLTMTCFRESSSFPGKNKKCFCRMNTWLHHSRLAGQEVCWSRVGGGCRKGTHASISLKI